MKAKAAASPGGAVVLQKRDEVVRCPRAGVPLLPEVPARGASPQCLGGAAGAGFASRGRSRSPRELLAETCRPGFAAKRTLHKCLSLVSRVLKARRSPVAEYVASDERAGSHPRYVPQQGSCNPSAQIDSEVNKNDRSETEPGGQPATRLSKL